MKSLSIVLAALLLASCSTTGMSSGESGGRGSGASGANDDCSTNPPGLYCGSD